jgi:uncharacterized membrane protein
MSDTWALTQSLPSRWRSNIPLVRYIHAFASDCQGCGHVVLTVTVIAQRAVIETRGLRRNAKEVIERIGWMLLME